MYKKLSKDEIIKRIIKFLKADINNSCNKDKTILDYSYEINLAVFCLFDTTKKSICNLDERETFVLRERFGINDSMIPKTMKELSKILGITTEYVRLVQNRAINILARRIVELKMFNLENLPIKDNVKKDLFNNLFISDLDYYKKEEIKDDINIIIKYLRKNKNPNPNNVIIEELNFSNVSYNALKAFNINTIYDLITKTKDDIFAIPNLGRKSYLEIINKIHFLGYTFIDESIEINENTTMIESLGFSNRTLNTLISAKIYTLNDLLSKTRNEIVNIHGLGDKVFNEVINKVYSLGYSLATEKSLDDKIKEGYDIKIEELNLNTRAYHYLKKTGINTVSDLLGKTTTQILQIHNIGKLTYNDILDKLHALGYKLIDEEDEKSLKIDSLMLGNRAYNALKKAGINTIDDLISKRKIDVSRIRGIGDTSLIDVYTKVHNLGYKFLDEVCVETNEELLNIKDSKEKLVKKYEETILEKNILLTKELELDMKIKEKLEEIKSMEKSNDKQRKYEN